MSSPLLGISPVELVAVAANSVAVIQGIIGIAKQMRQKQDPSDNEEMEKAWVLIEEQLKNLQSKTEELVTRSEAFPSVALDTDVVAPHYVLLHPFETMEPYVQNEVTEALNNYIEAEDLNVELSVTEDCIYLLLLSNDYRVSNHGSKREVYVDIVKPIAEKLDKEFDVWLRAVSYY